MYPDTEKGPADNYVTPDGMTPRDTRQVWAPHVGKTKVQGGTPLFIGNEVFPGPDFGQVIDELVIDEDFSILVDSVIEGREPPTKIGYKGKDGRIFSIFECFEAIVENEEAKVRQCIVTENFDYEDVALWVLLSLDIFVLSEFY